jgi:hypothetical protein
MKERDSTIASNIRQVFVEHHGVSCRSTSFDAYRRAGSGSRLHPLQSNRKIKSCN